jgi:predicted O-methyltransferase YrrM
MANRTLNLTDDLVAYVHKYGVREHPALAKLRERTAALPEHNMQIGPEQGAFMALLVRLIGAKQILEIGTFTGYSALCMAQVMPEDGRLICCDLPGEYNAIAERYWYEAGVSERIDLRLAPALETLNALERGGQSESFDLIFIDADKANYTVYLEHALVLARKGGLILFDNVLWGGRVLESSPDSADTRAIQALNRGLRRDTRVDLSLLPLGDGLSICRKR